MKSQLKILYLFKSLYLLVYLKHVKIYFKNTGILSLTMLGYSLYIEKTIHL